MFLEFKNISFSHSNDKKVLRDVSFSLNKGETLAIVGVSGSGKSTILRLIAGLLPNKSNQLVGSVKIKEESPSSYIKKGRLGFMFQEPTLFPNLTVKENIELPLQIKNQLDEHKILQLIETVGLKGYEGYLPKSLSGGMKTRVSLARSFVSNPELLLLDEPFSSLDIAWKDALYVELKELRNTYETTVVLVTHDILEAIELGDKIICISIEGKILLEENNIKDESLYSRIEETIINDHNLKRDSEKRTYISVI